MKGSCVIDGMDLADLGMFILKDGSNDLLSMPDRRPPEVVAYPEMNGVDADLSEIYFKEKAVTMRFFVGADSGGEMTHALNTFYALISAPGEREMYVREFEQTFKIRYEQIQQLTYKGGLVKPGRKKGELAVQFVMDDPLQLFKYPELVDPVGGRPSVTHVMLGSRDLSEFGIIVRQCYNTMLRHPAVKKPLIRSFRTMNGLKVSKPSAAYFETKNVTVECTMIADSRAEFFHNYEALFRALTKLEALELTTASVMERCYYSAMKNFKKKSVFDRRVKVDFDLEFVCLASGDVDILLATEDNWLVVTEDGEFYIDLGYGNK